MVVTGEIVKSAIAQAIINGIDKSLYTQIYKEKQYEGIITPCFYIIETQSIPMQSINNIFYILYNMDIRYHPKQDDPTPLETCDQMEISLLNVLNNLTSIHTRAKNIRFQIVGDFPVLHAFADYSVRMEYDDGIVQPLQENISSKILTK